MSNSLPSFKLLRGQYDKCCRVSGGVRVSGPMVPAMCTDCGCSLKGFDSLFRSKDMIKQL